MKIMVTGATGFIGKYVINEILKHNDIEIIATGIEENPNFSDDKRIFYKPYDVNQAKESTINLFNYFEKPDKLIHLAWEGLPNYKEMFHVEKNMPNHYYFLKNLIENGLKDITVTGTCLEYGMKYGPLKEDMDCSPEIPYAIAKDSLRKTIDQLHKKYYFILKWIRIFYLFGDGQSTNSILSQLDKALEENQLIFNMSGGEQLRDYLPVEKVANYIVKITLQNKVDGVINCCSGVPISIRKLVDNYLSKKNKTIELNLGYYPYIDYEPFAFWGDTDKLNKALIN